MHRATCPEQRASMLPFCSLMLILLLSLFSSSSASSIIRGSKAPQAQASKALHAPQASKAPHGAEAGQAHQEAEAESLRWRRYVPMFNRKPLTAAQVDTSVQINGQVDAPVQINTAKDASNANIADDASVADNANVADASVADAPNRTAPGGHLWPGLPFGPSTGALQYHGGPLMTGRINVYPIFYGGWQGRNFGQNSLLWFIASLSNASVDGRAVPSVHEWWSIMAPYYQVKAGKRVPIARTVKFGKMAVVNKGYLRQLQDGQGGTRNDIRNIVLNVINRKLLPADPLGFYPVITSKDIQVGSQLMGFCGYYCGWHDVTTRAGVALKYAMIGDPTGKCSDGCGGSLALKMTANGFYSVDSIINTFAHELAEAAANPELKNGWWASDSSGEYMFENCDLCNGAFFDKKFPKLPVYGVGVRGQFVFNVVGLAGHRYMVQSNVDIATQTCVLAKKR